MGLMQLLTVGRSLGRVGDEPSRYKMTQQSLLPKFGSVNAAENRTRGVSGTTNPAVTRADAREAKSSSAAAINDRKQMNAVQSELERKPAPSDVAPKPAFPRGRWTFFKNPFSRAPKPAAVATAPVQSELSLDMVKPVRNDLSDSDLELVQAARRRAEAPVQPVPPASVAPVVAGTEPVAAEGAAWNRIKNQFFGAGKA